MLTREEILAIIERIGSDNAPTAAELEAAQKGLARLIHEEAGSEAPSLETLTSLRKSFTDVGAALTKAQEVEAEQQAKIDEILADVPDPDVEEAEPSAEPEVTPVEAELPPPDAPVEVVDPADVEIVPVAASPAKTIPLRDAVSRVRQRPPAPVIAESEATGNEIWVNGVKVAKAPTLREAAHAFERVVRSPSTGKATVVRYDTVYPEDQILPGDTNGNSQMLDALVGPEAVAASGGCCSLPVPIRTQTVLNSSVRQIRDSLPNIGVTQAGAVTYFPAICMPDEGAAIWTCESDEAVDPEDPDTWKDCVVVECPTAETTIVHAVYKCLTIGEFQRRFATEQWVAILQATLAYQSRIAELRLWQQMLAAVDDTLTATATGSVFTNWAQSLQVTADSIRQDQRYIGVNINQWIPGWLPGAIASDFYARRLIDVPDPTVVAPLMNSVAANAGVTLHRNIDTDPMTHATPAYPATATTIVAPEGYYSYLDGGQFDLGIEIRDIDLARQNAVAAFAEGFEAILARGCNAWRVDVPVTICADAAGCA